MIQQQTLLNVLDNSGAKKVKCIKVLGGYKKKSSLVGEIIVVSVKELRNKHKRTSKVKKGEVHKALILKTKSKSFKKDGSSFFFNSNCVCLLNNQYKPLGSRILGPIPKIFKNVKYLRFSNISTGTV